MLQRLLFFVSLLFFATTGYANKPQANYLKSGHVQVKYCHSKLEKLSYSYKLVAKRSGEVVMKNVTKEGGKNCIANAKFKYGNSGLKAGDTVQVFHPNRSLTVEFVVKRINNDPNGGGNNGGGNNGGGGTVEPDPKPVPQKPRYSVSRAKLEGEEAASLFIDALLEGYGTIEMIRFNLRSGIQDARRYFQLIAQGDVERLNAYKVSLQNNAHSGTASGRTAGLNKANTQADADARARVKSQFQGALGSGVLPAPNNEKTKTINGLKGGKQVSKSLNGRLKSKTNSVIDEVRSELRWNDQCLILRSETYVSLFDLEVIAGWDRYENDLLLRRYRSDSALNAWYNGSITRCLGQTINGFENLRNINKYSNATQAANAFKTGFINEYEATIDSLWIRKTQQTRRNVVDLGKDIYISSLDSYATEKGKVDGYNSSYRAASKSAYNGAYSAAFTSSYDAVYAIQSNSVDVKKPQLTVIGSNGSRKNFPGQKLTLYINSIENHGGKDATIKVQVSGTRGLTVDREAKEIVVPKLTRLSSSEDLVFADIAQVSNSIQPGQKAVLTVTVGQYSQKFSVEINFGSLVVALAQTGDRTILSTIVQKMKNSWSKNAGAFGADFDGCDVQRRHRRQQGCFDVNTDIERFAKAFDELNEEGKDAIRNFKRELRTIYPSKRPSGFFSTTKGDWDDVNRLFQRRGLL